MTPPPQSDLLPPCKFDEQSWPLNGTLAQLPAEIRLGQQLARVTKELEKKNGTRRRDRGAKDARDFFLRELWGFLEGTPPTPGPQSVLGKVFCALLLSAEFVRDPAGVVCVRVLTTAAVLFFIKGKSEPLARWIKYGSVTLNVSRDFFALAHDPHSASGFFGAVAEVDGVRPTAQVAQQRNRDPITSLWCVPAIWSPPYDGTSRWLASESAVPYLALLARFLTDLVRGPRVPPRALGRGQSRALSSARRTVSVQSGLVWCQKVSAEPKSSINASPPRTKSDPTISRRY
ncbi:hypothetical protein BC827DRAFT_1314555 [Russula dissimulans]|nr:hypothetical protein BC827DRAFT_1314555 [Russula dissimulans]